MRVKGLALIVGGGKMGYFLARNMSKADYRVRVLDLERSRSKRIADELGIIAYTGDGTNEECLRASGADEADYVIAMTDRDEVNLVVCQLAKRGFGVGMTVALVSDPKNEELFDRLGVDETMCASSMAVRMIERLLPARGVRFLSEIGRSAAEICEFALEKASPAVGAAVSGLGLPAECVLVAVSRGDKVLFPRGDTLLREGDRVYGLSKADELPALRRALLGD